MIRARKGGLITAAWDFYVRRKFKRAFRAMWTRGALPDDGQPRLVYLNHTNFWDGFVVHQLAKVAGWDGYCLMEEHNLARYPFLARIGAFSIRRGEGQSSLQTLRYAKSLLSLPRASVFVFPEGKIGPFTPRRLELERGVELLARTAKVECLPVGVRYAFFEDEHPDVVLEVGSPHRAGPVEDFAARLQAVVDRVATVTSLEEFKPVLTGARGVAERWDGAKKLLRAGRGAA